ncbi:MAG: hypothetical protein ACQESC_00580 [Nanobdellota archaeon]
MDSLTVYIHDMLEQGYTVSQIESYLLSQGYSSTVIQASIHKAASSYSSGKRTYHHQETLSEQLYTYILSMLERGYTPQNIAQTLDSQGYDTKTIQTTFSRINKDHYKGTLSLPTLKSPRKKTIMFTSVILLLLAVIGIFFAQSILDATPLDDDTSMTQSQNNTYSAESSSTTFPSENNSSSADNTSEFEPLPKQSSQLFADALQSNSIETAMDYCDQLSSSHHRSLCLTELAHDYNSTQACQYIVSPSREKECLLSLATNGHTQACSLLPPDEKPLYCIQDE